VLSSAVSSSQGTRTAVRAAAAGGAPPLIVDAPAPSVVAAAAAAALATIARAAVVDAREGQEVFVKEGVGVGMIIVIVVTAVTNIFLWRARGCRQNAPKRPKTLQNATKRRKYRELAISLRGTKYLGGIKNRPLFRSVEINRVAQNWGPQPPFPPENIFSGFFLALPLLAEW